MSNNAIERIQRANNRIDPQLWIVTAQSGDRRGGLVATFVTKASIVTDCPRYLIGIAKQHHTWGLIEASNAVGLHLVGSDQLDWIVQLGGQSGHTVADKLQGLSCMTLQTGAPILSEAIAGFDCRVEARLNTGDRTVYLLQVKDAISSETPQRPLRFSDLAASLPPEQFQKLGELYARDQETDRQAILDWRADCLEAQSS